MENIDFIENLRFRCIYSDLKSVEKNKIYEMATIVSLTEKSIDFDTNCEYDEKKNIMFISRFNKNETVIIEFEVLFDYSAKILISDLSLDLNVRQYAVAKALNLDYLLG